MVSLEVDLELPAPQRAELNAWVRELIPSCDPDGSGRIEVRVRQTDAKGAQVEIACANPHVRAIVVDEDPASAVRRAFRRVAAALGESSHG